MAKVDDLKIKGTLFDRRRKLSLEQTADLKDCAGLMSVREAASLFNISRRLVQFVWYPERQEHNLLLRKLRGTEYNTREALTRATANLRNYKRALLKEGKIKPPEKGTKP